jgi:hypothetical protein
MSSNVGSRSTYEAGDQVRPTPPHERHVLIQLTDTLQRTVSDAEIKAQQEANRFHEGKENSHKANDSSTFTRDP